MGTWTIGRKRRWAGCTVLNAASERGAETRGRILRVRDARQLGGERRRKECQCRWGIRIGVRVGIGSIEHRVKREREGADACGRRAHVVHPVQRAGVLVCVGHRWASVLGCYGRRGLVWDTGTTVVERQLGSLGRDGVGRGSECARGVRWSTPSRSATRLPVHSSARLRLLDPRIRSATRRRTALPPWCVPGIMARQVLGATARTHGMVAAALSRRVSARGAGCWPRVCVGVGRTLAFRTRHLSHARGVRRTRARSGES